MQKITQILMLMIYYQKAIVEEGPALKRFRPCARGSSHPYKKTYESSYDCFNRRSLIIMGQKVNPIGFRLGVRRNWSARWYANKHDYSKFLEEDNLIRGFLRKNLRFASVPRVVIERASRRLRVTIWTARPGIVIGRKGQELDTLGDSLNRHISNDIRLEIQEIKKPDLVASLVAENVALQLERRIAFQTSNEKSCSNNHVNGC